MNRDRCRRESRIPRRHFRTVRDSKFAQERYHELIHVEHLTNQDNIRILRSRYHLRYHLAILYHPRIHPITLFIQLAKRASVGRNSRNLSPLLRVMGILTSLVSKLPEPTVGRTHPQTFPAFEDIQLPKPTSHILSDVRAR